MSDFASNTDITRFPPSGVPNSDRAKIAKHDMYPRENLFKAPYVTITVPIHGHVGFPHSHSASGMPS